MSLTVERAQYRLAADFRAAGLATAALDARLLTGFAVGFDALALICHSKQSIKSWQLERLETLATKRLAGMPVSRLINRREFYGLAFHLTADTFDPRPESEHLVAAMIEKAKHFSAPHILDLGTGSACLLIACLKHIESACGLGVDISRRALRQARINAARHGVRARAFFRQSNWLQSVCVRRERFALILCNPPYIRDKDIAHLAPEVRLYDPPHALAGGADGLAIYRLLVPQLSAYLLPQGWVGFEIGEGQADYVVGLFEKYAFSDIEVKNDLAGRPRIVLACRP